MANRSVVCYATPGKAKAALICEAFASGARAHGVTAEVLRQAPPSLLDGAAVFYGVTTATQHLWRQVREQRRPYYFIDNSYFDLTRGTHYRVTKNAIQASGQEQVDSERASFLESMGLRIEQWRQEQSKSSVLLLPQSDEFMQVVAGWPQKSSAWERDALQRISQFTKRPLVVRVWDRDKKAAASTLRAALRDVWAVVTYASAGANEALLAGVPVFTNGPCAASAMAETDFTKIEQPRYPWSRNSWVAALAGMQWTLEEIAAGLAWARLSREHTYA